MDAGVRGIVECEGLISRNVKMAVEFNFTTNRTRSKCVRLPPSNFTAFRFDELN